MLQSVQPPNHSAIIIALGPDDIVPVVKDLSYAKPLWKFPGGGGEVGETPRNTAKRELKEETGLDVGCLLWLMVHVSNGHHTHCFATVLDTLEGWQKFGDENEIGKLIAVSDITRDDFLPPHWRLLQCLHRIVGR